MLGKEDPEKYHIFEVGFKTLIKASRHQATLHAAIVGGNQLNTEFNGWGVFHLVLNYII